MACRVTRSSSCHRDEFPPRTSRTASFIHECGTAINLFLVSRKVDRTSRIASMVDGLFFASKSAKRSSAPPVDASCSSIAFVSFFTRSAKPSEDSKASGHTRSNSLRFSSVKRRRVSRTLRKSLVDIWQVFSKGTESENHSKVVRSRLTASAILAAVPR